MALEHSNSRLFIGRQHIRLKTVNSTNLYAADFISKSNPMEGTVISASYQSHGKGQIGRNWVSDPDKNIMTSIILAPTFLFANQQFLLNIAISLGVCDFVKAYLSTEDHNVKIKWPNDIYIGNDKVAGILIQNTLKGKRINASIAGIGININQTSFPETLPNPISLIHLLNVETNIEEALDNLFQAIDNRYAQLKSGDYASLRKMYDASLFRKDEWAKFMLPDEHMFEGKIKGVDDIGRLQIEYKSGELQSFAFRELTYCI